MAKLSFVLNGKFKTFGFRYQNHESGIIEMMPTSAVREIFSRIDPNDLGLSIIGFDGEGLCEFNYGTTDQKKRGALFNVSLNADATGLDVEMTGEWSVKLRPGADEQARNCSFYLEGITYKGGSWSGFTSRIEGLVDDQQEVPVLDENGNPVIFEFENMEPMTQMRTIYNFDTWPKVTEVSVK